MALLVNILRILAPLATGFVQWAARRKAAQNQAGAEARLAAVRRDPGREWLCKFNSRANADKPPRSAPGAAQSQRDA